MSSMYPAQLTQAPAPVEIVPMNPAIFNQITMLPTKYDMQNAWSYMLQLAAILKAPKWAENAMPFVQMNLQLKPVYRALKHAMGFTGRVAWNVWYTLQSHGYAQLQRAPLNASGGLTVTQAASYTAVQQKIAQYLSTGRRGRR